MSIFDFIFGKKPSRYDIDPSDPDYEYYTGIRATGETAQEMLDAVSDHGDMPPFIPEKVTEELPKSQTDGQIPQTLGEPPADAEDTAYESWAKDKVSTSAQTNPTKCGKTVVPPSPNIPAKPNVEPITTGKVVYPKGSPFGSDFGKRSSPWRSSIPVIPEKDVYAFIVENSSDTLTQREKIINIISQTVEKNKDAIFIFVRVGNNQTPYLPMDYKSVKDKDIVCTLISEEINEDTTPNLVSALFYLANNLKVFDADTFSFGKTKYKLGNCSIVCIGTGACMQNEDSNRIISSCIYKLQNISKLKTFKYFCIKDTDSIKVATLGFPVIGHIIPDFYE